MFAVCAVVQKSIFFSSLATRLFFSSTCGDRAIVGTLSTIAVCVLVVAFNTFCRDFLVAFSPLSACASRTAAAQSRRKERGDNPSCSRRGEDGGQQPSPYRSLIVVRFSPLSLPLLLLLHFRCCSSAAAAAAAAGNVVTATQYLVLDSSSIHDLDSSSLKTLEGLVALLVDRDPPIEIFLAPVSDPLMVQASPYIQMNRLPKLTTTMTIFPFPRLRRVSRRMWVWRLGCLSRHSMLIVRS